MTSKLEKQYIADFDDLNVIGASLYSAWLKNRKSEDEVFETVVDWIVGGFNTGYMLGLEDLDSDEVGYTFYENAKNNGAFIPIVQSIINREIDGKTTKERVSDALLSSNGVSALNKILTTEYHHAVNKGIFTCGESYNERLIEIFKTWKTMLDFKVRDSHAYLEGKTIPLEDEFYTYNGDHALFPGEFDVPEEDCGCRCRAKLSKRKATTVTGK